MITSAFDRTVSLNRTDRGRSKPGDTPPTMRVMNRRISLSNENVPENNTIESEDDEEIAVNCYSGVQSDFDSSDDDEEVLEDDPLEEEEAEADEEKEEEHLVTFVHVPLSPATPIMRPKAYSPTRQQPHVTHSNEETYLRVDTLEDEDSSNGECSSVGARGVGVTFGNSMEEDNETSDISEDETTVMDTDCEEGSVFCGNDEEEEDNDDAQDASDEDNISREGDAQNLNQERSDLIAEADGSRGIYDDMDKDNDQEILVASLEQSYDRNIDGLDEEISVFLDVIKSPDKEPTWDLLAKLIGVTEDRSELPVMPKSKRILSFHDLNGYLEQDGDVAKRSKVFARNENEDLPPLNLGPPASHTESNESRPPARTLSQVKLELDFCENEKDLDSQLRDELSSAGNGDSRENSPVELLTPPGSPVPSDGVEKREDWLEWPSNLAIETALASSYELRPMSPDSLEQLEREEDERIRRQPPSSGDVESTTLTPMLKGIYVG